VQKTHVGRDQEQGSRGNRPNRGDDAIQGIRDDKRPFPQTKKPERNPENGRRSSPAGEIEKNQISNNGNPSDGTVGASISLKQGPGDSRRPVVVAGKWGGGGAQGGGMGGGGGGGWGGGGVSGGGGGGGGGGGAGGG